MDIIRVYFNGSDGKAKELSFATSSWYHKPKIISAMAYALQFSCNQEFLFATSTKYGCGQFEVKQSKSFPVHNLDFCYFQQRLPWLVPEFNDFAEFKHFEKSSCFKYHDVLKECFPDFCVDVISYLHERNHEHHIVLSGVNLDSLKDIPDDITLLPIENK